MAQVLYRKYRPQCFSEVADQNHIKVTLQHQIESGTIGHAYLFCGPRGVSKTTMARILAKSLNCTGKPAFAAEPCNQCNSCLEIMQTRSLDVLEIDAASHTGVDHIRENIIDHARFTPFQSPYKVFIIDEVHMLSTSAFNALLKTLEEPPSHVIFIIVTTEVQKLPMTIISRCQRFDFRKIPFSDIVASLNHVVTAEGRTIEPSVLESVARYADGCLRDGLSLLDQILALGDQHITLEQAALVLPVSQTETVMMLLEHLIQNDLPGALLVLEEAAEQGSDLKHLLDEMLYLLRHLLLAKISQRFDQFLLHYSDAHAKQLLHMMDVLELSALMRFLDILLYRRQSVKTIPLPSLSLELALVQFFQEERSQSSSKSTQQVSNVLGSRSTHVNQVRDTKDEVLIAKDQKPAERSPVPELELVHTPTEVPIEGSIESLPGVSLDIVKEKWKSIVELLEAEHHSLALLLQIARPLALNGSLIQIGFQFELHRKRILEPKNAQVIREKLFELLGVKVQIECVISEQAKIDILPIEEMVRAEIGNAVPLEQDPYVGTLLKEFGGKIIG